MSCLYRRTAKQSHQTRTPHGAQRQLATEVQENRALTRANCRTEDAVTRYRAAQQQPPARRYHRAQRQRRRATGEHRKSVCAATPTQPHACAPHPPEASRECAAGSKPPWPPGTRAAAARMLQGDEVPKGECHHFWLGSISGTKLRNTFLSVWTF
jgi:hypothetical protein